MKDVNGQDQIENINDLSEKICPGGFIFQKFDQYILYYRIFYDNDDDTPYLESIKVDINNNEQHIESGNIRKDDVRTFKARQTLKRKSNDD